MRLRVVDYQIEQRSSKSKKVTQVGTEQPNFPKMLEIYVINEGKFEESE